MTYTYAVRYTQPLLGASGAAGYLTAIPGASILVRQHGVACLVYANRTLTPMTNPVPTGVPPGSAGVDTLGNLMLYLLPGDGYDFVATVGASSVTVALPGIPTDPHEEDRVLAAALDPLIVGAITRDASGAALSAAVVWPSGATGAYTATVVSSSFPGAVDAYTVTHVLGGVTTTYTQPAVTRNADGAVIARPAIVVS